MKFPSGKEMKKKMNTRITKRNYGNYSSSNYGAHTQQFSIGSLDIFYSYNTVVAFRDGYDGLVISKNYWGSTTGKHLNWINSNKKIRVDSETFDQKLSQVLKKHKLDVK